MISLNINVNKLSTLLELAQLKGLDNSGKTSPMIDRCVMVINKKSKTMEINGIGNHNTLIFMIKMKCEDGEIIRGGNLPIKFSNIMSTLSKCKGIIKFEYKTGKYIVTPPNDSVVYTKAAIDEDEIDNNIEDISKLNWKYIKKSNVWKSKKYTLGTWFNIEPGEFKKLIGDAKEVDYYIYSVYITPKGIKFIVHNSNDGSNTTRDLKIEDLDCKSEIESIYSVGMGNVINNLCGESVECWIDSNSPLIIEFTVDNIAATYILSPYNAEEEEEDEEESSTESEMSEELEESLLTEDDEAELAEIDFEDKYEEESDEEEDLEDEEL
jgi:hypothetical protein